jgi:hypothetical protein
MNKILALGSAAVAMFAVTACSSQDGEDLKAEVVTATIQAAINDNSSRVATTDEGKCAWTEGDQIYTLTDRAVYKYKSAGEDGTATFATSATNVTGSEYAVYPYVESAPATIDGNTLTYTFPTEYTYTVTDGKISEVDNSPMLGTLNEDGVYNFKHLASVIRLQIPTLPKTTTKVVFETLNTPITGTYTATVTDETPTLKASEETGGNSVTVNFSEALTADITDARILIPVPAGTLTGGFRISVYEGSTLYSSYTTYKDKTATRNKLMLYTLYPNTEAATTDDGGVIAYLGVNKGSKDSKWTISSVSSSSIGNQTVKISIDGTTTSLTDKFMKLPADTYTITSVDNKKITKITFVGQHSNTTTTSSHSITCSLSSDTSKSESFALPYKDSSVVTHTIVPYTASSTISFTLDRQSYFNIYVTYTN